MAKQAPQPSVRAPVCTRVCEAGDSWGCLMILTVEDKPAPRLSRTVLTPQRDLLPLDPSGSVVSSLSSSENNRICVRPVGLNSVAR